MLVAWDFGAGELWRRPNSPPMDMSLAAACPGSWFGTLLMHWCVACSLYCCGWTLAAAWSPSLCGRAWRRPAQVDVMYLMRLCGKIRAIPAMYASAFADDLVDCWLVDCVGFAVASCVAPLPFPLLPALERPAFPWYANCSTVPAIPADLHSGLRIGLHAAGSLLLLG